MPEYIVKRGKIGRDGKVYGPGDRINLAKEIADILPQGRVEPVAGPAKAEEPLLEEPTPPAGPDPTPAADAKTNSKKKK